jgi:hypothetical protein
MSDSDSIKKYAFLAGGLALAGAALFYLAQDSSPTGELDPKVHSQELMMQMQDEIHLEFQCMYVRNFNKILHEHHFGQYDGPKGFKKQEFLSQI